MQNCRGKLTFKVAETHLALRSPMFGEFWVWFFLCGFERNWWFRWGIYVKSGLVEMFKKYVYVEYDSEAPKRRSPNIGERSAKWVKLLMQF